MASLEIGNRNLSLQECMPANFEFLDNYQRWAYSQIVWDEGQGTIRGKMPRRYMLDGLLEEMREMTLDPDRQEPNYSRYGALVLLEGNEQLMPGNATPTAVERHIKEFGDVSWYLANYLRMYDLDFSRTIPVGIAAWHLDALSQPRANLEFMDTTSRLFPWSKLFSAYGELKTAARGVVHVPRDERILPEQALLIASGKLVTTMAHLAVTRFGTTYQAILEGNRHKLEKRIKDGTVFDKSGGDDR